MASDTAKMNGRKIGKAIYIKISMTEGTMARLLMKLIVDFVEMERKYGSVSDGLGSHVEEADHG